MRYIILIVLSFLFIKAHGQQMPDYVLDKIRITEPEQTIVAELLPVSSNIAANANLHYYWYSANAIHETQGGYSGHLLNGLYSVFYLNKNLKEQGHFRKGLKNGIWRNWKEDGSLATTTTWKRGLEITEKRPSFCKRLPLLHKKAKATDSVSKVKEQSKK